MVRAALVLAFGLTACGGARGPGADGGRDVPARDDATRAADVAQDSPTDATPADAGSDALAADDAPDVVAPTDATAPPDAASPPPDASPADAACLPPSAYTPRWTANPASNAGMPIVATSDPTVTTHEIHSGTVTLGVSALGGGYVNEVRIAGGPNIASPNYGRGWQSALRDELHSGRYNPTQAGFVDTAGARVAVRLAGNVVTVAQMEVPLFEDSGVYDYTEHEDLVADAYPADRGLTDTDGIVETSITQDAEIRSEFDFGGTFEDASAVTGIPSIRHRFYYAYARAPGAIRQFGAAGTQADGTAVIDGTRRVRDISRLLAGDQTPTDDDLSAVHFSDFGLRFVPAASHLRFAFWHASGGWVTTDLTTTPDIDVDALDRSFAAPYRTVSGAMVAPAPHNTADLPLAIVSDARDPLAGSAVGLYLPQWGINACQTVGVARTTGAIVYRDDRRMKLNISFEGDTGGQVVIRPVLFLAGLLAPGVSMPGVIEAIHQDVFVLFGTPDAILRAVVRLELRTPS